MATSKPSDGIVRDSQVLSAEYQSPHNVAFTATHQIPAPPSSKTEDRTAYLAALRKATVVMQEQINTELTVRMEEDKVREAEGANGTAKARGIDEAKEEDTYGEEVVEEE